MNGSALRWPFLLWCTHRWVRGGEVKPPPGVADGGFSIWPLFEGPPRLKASPTNDDARDNGTGNDDARNNGNGSDGRRNSRRSRQS